MCDKPIPPDEIFKLTLEIHGPKTEAEMKTFVDALKKLLEKYKVTPTELHWKVK